MRGMGTRGPSPRQLLILLLLAQGYSIAQVAALLGASVEHVEEGAAHAARALDAVNWRAGIAAARQRHLF